MDINSFLLHSTLFPLSILLIDFVRFEAKKDDYPGYNVWGAGISEVSKNVNIRFLMF